MVGTENYIGRHMLRILSLTSILILVVIVVTPVEAGFRDDYDAAFTAYKAASTREQILKVASRFSQLTTRKDAGSLIANAHYWQGECYYDVRDYERALNCFERALLYPKSNKEEAARFKVAICNLLLNNPVTAKWEFSRFLRDYPSSHLAPRVRKELQKLSGK